MAIPNCVSSYTKMHPICTKSTSHDIYRVCLIAIWFWLCSGVCMRALSSVGKGVAAFDRFYASVYGERWQSLRRALMQPVSHIQVPHGKTEESRWYSLDAASIFPCLALLNPDLYRYGATEAHQLSILDACSAPGGKSVVMGNMLLQASSSNPDCPFKWQLSCNELSAARRARLRRVLNTFNDRVNSYTQAHNCQVSIHSCDFSSSPDRIRHKCFDQLFDLTLLDAPCSSERHLLLHDADELSKWTLSRSKRNAQRQLQLSLNAVQFTRPGGRIVYSTCSLSPLENDGLISSLLSKLSKPKNLERYQLMGTLCSSNPVSVLKPKLEDLEVPDGIRQQLFSGTSVTEDIRPEETEHGYLVLPDTSGYGPMYVCILQLNSADRY